MTHLPLRSALLRSNTVDEINETSHILFTSLTFYVLFFKVAPLAFLFSPPKGIVMSGEVRGAIRKRPIAVLRR